MHFLRILFSRIRALQFQDLKYTAVQVRPRLQRVPIAVYVCTCLQRVSVAVYVCPHPLHVSILV